MIQNIHVEEILKLSVEEKILAMQKIWDSIPDDESDGISLEQLALLEKRLEEYHANPSIALTWNNAKNRIASSRVR